MNTHAPEDVKQSLPEERGEDLEELSRGEVTRLLLDWNNGDAAARDRLVTLVYGELRRMAHLLLLGERVGHSMQTGALVNEVYLRLFDANGVPCRNRKEFFGIVARQMRQVLVDAARNRKVKKRGGSRRRVPLEDAALVAPALNLDLIALGEALDTLAQLDEELCRVVELHHFAGFTIEETAEIMSIPVYEVKRLLKKAKIYLHDELTRTKEVVQVVSDDARRK
jgi:RNA polymerase sigma factor (TIGR02999 family)